MSYPSLLNLQDQAEYQKHWIIHYSKKGLQTFDGIVARFRHQDFEHAFFESVNSKDDIFSWKRAERMDWIASTLRDPTSELYVGWNKKEKKYDDQRRVAIAMGNYVVVIEISKKNPKQARFVTAYVADTPARPSRPSTIDMIRKSPRWK